MTSQAGKIIHGPSLFTEHDIYLFREGSHYKLHEKLGSHPGEVEGKPGVQFAVWAPNASTVSVVGDFNGWDPEAHPLTYRLDSSGVWEGFIPGLEKGAMYKYHVDNRSTGYTAAKGDPYSFMWQCPPETASMVWDLDYEWGDQNWMAGRGEKNGLKSPISIYEVHLGSWRRKDEPGYPSLSYRDMAEQLVEYVRDTGFTHVEFLPVMEHPFFGSWGYQTVGYFAPSSRYGTPQDFMYLVDRLHQEGIGVILDWVPSHFPTDEHGLSYYDGTHLYEHADPREGYHQDWNSYIFNHGRSEVVNFLISSAVFWLDRYHVDGLRVDAVASLLYRDYSRKEGEWVPNEHGGRENLEAIEFIKRMNETLYTFFPDILTVAEESTAWPLVSRPVYVGGLGFGMKWKMGWMHDTRSYMSRDPIHRSYHHDKLTFSMWYAYHENFVLPLSHDEVVHGKGSLIGKMPGDDWRKFANLRLLYGYMYAHPGKKLLFMGGEIAQWSEWRHDGSIEWHLLEYEKHSGMRHWLGDLNRVLKEEPALHRLDFEREGFEWIDHSDYRNSILSFVRRSEDGKDTLIVIGNFTPTPRLNYRVGVPSEGTWEEILNSDATFYGGSGAGNFGGVESTPVPYHGYYNSVSLHVPPLGLIILKARE